MRYDDIKRSLRAFHARAYDFVFGVPKPSELLKEARFLLAEKGWAQKEFEAKDARGKTIGYCAVGALRVATNPKTTEEWSDKRMSVYLDARRYLDRAVPLTHTPEAITYNDLPTTNKEDVFMLVSEARRLAETEGK